MTAMRLVVLGLSLSSSWGNGHATTYRALLRALAARGHHIVFLERDQPWYASHRDMPDPDFCRLQFYDETDDLSLFENLIAEADAVIVGSYVPDGIEIGRLVQRIARGATAFYDIDTPVTLAKLRDGSCEYLSAELIPLYDLYLSFTGGPTLDLLMNDHGSPAARALYCSVDEHAYRPIAGVRRYDLGYLGTYSPDRQPTLEKLLLEPARRRPDLRFAVAGAQYPADIDWPGNVTRLEHVPPSEHPAFYGACRFTLNVTRADMIRAGHSPSVRIFEAAACGTPILSDIWAGIDAVLAPGREIALVQDPDEVLAWLGCDEPRREAMAAAARHRTLAAHTATHRAAELEDHLRAAVSRRERAAARVDLTAPFGRTAAPPANPREATA
ncbi:glycosyltransferase [Bosea sp. CS1GBMeth4]|uniref:CgeB family protein n=1 Tax=Bosea sp. CS1GBMeth4 TaxID=1892849 RepID=UPI001AEC8A42|nr:glycosyltransferase [Bosea sp. CS1GBMeth4]